MKFLPLWAILWIGLLNSCHQTNQRTESTTTGSPDSPTPWVKYGANDISTDTTSFTQPQQVGRLDDESLTEASGLVASRRNPGYLWTEEDSGNPNQIQLIHPNGQIVARFTLDGLTNYDWEDIAVGPGPLPNQSYLYVAEIGDNDLQYPEKIMYRFPEPALVGKKLPYEGHISAIETIRLKLPDGPQNAEAMLIDPATTDLFILSKGDHSTLYRAAFPQSVRHPTMMTRQVVLPFSRVTSANISPDGHEILIRTYRQLFYYKRQPGESITDALKRTPRLLPLADEPQGEAVGWAIDGSGYYTTSEQTLMTSQVVYFYRRNR